MTYDTKVTSKGTVTIAAPLRKSLGIQTGQKLTVRVNEHGEIVLKQPTDMAAFEKKRAQIVAKIPAHLKGLSGQKLKDAKAAAWVAGYSD